MSKLKRLKEKVDRLERENFHLRCRISALANALGYYFMHVPKQSGYYSLIKMKPTATEARKKK